MDHKKNEIEKEPGVEGEPRAYTKPTVKEYEVYETSALGGSCFGSTTAAGQEDCIQTS